jgi:hypothetical protein
MQHQQVMQHQPHQLWLPAQSLVRQMRLAVVLYEFEQLVPEACRNRAGKDRKKVLTSQENDKTQ